MYYCSLFAFKVGLLLNDGLSKVKSVPVEFVPSCKVHFRPLENHQSEYYQWRRSLTATCYCIFYVFKDCAWGPPKSRAEVPRLSCACVLCSIWHLVSLVFTMKLLKCCLQRVLKVEHQMIFKADSNSDKLHQLVRSSYSKSLTVSPPAEPSPVPVNFYLTDTVYMTRDTKFLDLDLKEYICYIN